VRTRVAAEERAVVHSANAKNTIRGKSLPDSCAGSCPGPDSQGHQTHKDTTLMRTPDSQGHQTHKDAFREQQFK